jgi:hypothetical protein
MYKFRLADNPEMTYGKRVFYEQVRWQISSQNTMVHVPDGIF